MLLGVATVAFLSGAVVGALMVSIHVAKAPVFQVTDGGKPAFRTLDVAPPPAIARAEAKLAELEQRPVFVPSKEARERRLALIDSPLGALRKHDGGMS